MSIAASSLSTALMVIPSPHQAADSLTSLGALVRSVFDVELHQKTITFQLK